MRIHTNTIEREQLWNALPNNDLFLEVSRHGSRSRRKAYEVSLEWTGEKTKGDGRHRRNIGTSGGGFNQPWVATWDEWGEWLAKLFDLDPDMKATYYDGRADFYAKTRQAFEYRKDKGSKAPWLEAEAERIFRIDKEEDKRRCYA